MNSPIARAFDDAKKTVQIDPDMALAFEKRISKNATYLKHDGVDDHFCVGVLLVDRAKQRVFLGHHIKSDHWLGAGGHMEPGETPLQTAIRETKEELGLDLAKFELYNLTYFDDVHRHLCREHYDFFFYHEFDSDQEVKADPSEFHTATWVPFDTVLSKKLMPRYRTAIQQLLASFGYSEAEE